jgi:hypothetical protein
MKRCPECEFVYEENQNLCDMDGAVLVHDPHELPKNPTRSRPGKSILQLIAMALPSILLATILLYGSTPQEARTETSATEVIEQAEPSSYLPASAAQPASSPAAEESVKTDSIGSGGNGSKGAESSSSPSEGRPSATHKPEAQDDSSDTKTEPEPKSSPETTVGTPIPAPKGVPPGSEPVRREPRRPSSSAGSDRKTAHESNKEKVKSFFKKTGRLLKKPFQN